MTAFDPRTRLVVALCWAGLIVGSGHATVLLGELAALTGLVALWRQVRPFLRWMRLVLPMAVFLGAVTWWTAGQQHGLAAAVKLVGIATTFFLFFVTTAPEDLANALVKAGTHSILSLTVGGIITGVLVAVPGYFIALKSVRGAREKAARLRERKRKKKEVKKHPDRTPKP